MADNNTIVTAMAAAAHQDYMLDRIMRMATPEGDARLREKIMAHRRRERAEREAREDSAECEECGGTGEGYYGQQCGYCRNGRRLER